MKLVYFIGAKPIYFDKELLLCKTLLIIFHIVSVHVWDHCGLSSFPKDFHSSTRAGNPSLELPRRCARANDERIFTTNMKCHKRTLALTQPPTLLARLRDSNSPKRVRTANTPRQLPHHYATSTQRQSMCQSHNNAWWHVWPHEPHVITKYQNWVGKSGRFYQPFCILACRILVFVPLNRWCHVIYNSTWEHKKRHP